MSASQNIGSTQTTSLWAHHPCPCAPAREASQAQGETPQRACRLDRIDPRPHERYHGGVLIEDYGGLHPAKYHRALREAARARGAILVSHAPVLNIDHEREHFRVRTQRGGMRAREVAVGTNGYTDRAMPYLYQRVVPVTAYVVATKPLPEGMAKAVICGRMLSDTQHDLFWMRLSPDGERLIFGARRASSRPTKEPPRKTCTA